MNDIEQIEKKIVSDLETLKSDLETIRRLKNKYLNQTKEPIIETRLETSHLNGQSLGVKGSIEKLFNQYPNKSWTPKLIEEELYKLRSAGQLLSEAKDLRIAAHTVLKVLVKKSIVIKYGNKRIPTYKLKQ